MLKSRIQQLLQQISQSLIERDEALRLLMLAALAGEHLLLIGPPGTAKSELARRLRLAFEEGEYFERLLTRFSVPEELFGPLSIKALEEDRYERLTQNYLPQASIAFIDEIFKANSAILNTLLTLLNEREFDNGHQRFKTPLITVVAASNELPEDLELGALYDRFLLRYQVSPVSESGFADLLQINEDQGLILDKTLSLTPKELTEIQQQAQQIPLSEDVIYLLKELRNFLQEKSIYISDRRWRKVIKLLKVSAFTNQQSEVNVWDCWLFQHCLWETPEQQSVIFNWYQDRIGTSEVVNLQRLNKLVQAWSQTLNEEKSRTVPLYNEYGEKLYYNPQGEATTESGRDYLAERDGEALYLTPPDYSDRTNDGNGLTRAELEQNYFDDYYRQRHIDGKWVTIDTYVADQENRFHKRINYDLCQEPAKYSSEHVNERCSELDVLLKEIADYQQQTQNMIDMLDEKLGQHLWVSPTFSQTAKQILKKNKQKVVALTKEIETIREGFKQLPLAA